MESPTQSHYPESPTMEDDIVYPCKGCGEILEEGKAFELAGNRWHIDCFRCNTCGTLLDSDANLLLLGDGSLICNNCTYSCNHCGNKIEDLAILTGDQAFCANCFRCRNCKRKIENLRYARTSQGIFCMGCHESLMARRRKKTKKPPSNVPKVDKSLPALPPSAPSGSAQFTPDLDTPSDIFSESTTTDVSPRPPHPASFRRDASPASLDDHRSETLTSNIYREPNHSEADNTSDDNGILLPFALDPNTAPGPSPNSSKTHSRPGEGKTPRDYFNRAGASSHREMLKENRSRSASSERQPPKSPHIAYQEKGRQPSDQVSKRKEVATEPTASSTDRTRNQHASQAASQPSEGFKLQEVPKHKKAEARKNSLARTPSLNSSANDKTGRLMSPPPDNLVTSPGQLETSPATSGSSYSSTQRVERPARGDSLNAAHRSQSSTTRKEVAPHSPPSPTTPTMSQPERKTPANGGARSQQNGSYNISSPAESIPSRSMSDPPIPPQRSAGRPPPPAVDTFVSPRVPPQPPPPLQNYKAPESASAALQETMSPGALPRYSAQGDFSQDEDFARLLMNQDGQDREGGGVLRRVSNAMTKHSRSFSDRGSVNQRGHKKWPTNGSIDISSPTMPSPDSKEENVNLRNELRRAQQKVAELEAEKNGLQESVHNAADLKQANTMLREKRNTMAVLDTQREMVIRELEIMTEHLKQAKESNNNSVDYNQMKSDVIKDFANALQKLKDQMGGQIEDLISKRTALTDEISNLIQMKDKGFQEYESLSAQNKKLSDMNQNLIESIQGMLQKNKQANGGQSIDASRSPANGLGIYQHNHKAGKSEISFDSPQVISHEPSYSNLHDTEHDAVLVQPQLVSVRKGKPTKFSNWKKGGQAMKNVTKGFKGAFAASEPRQEDYNTVKVIGTPYGSTHTQPDLVSLASTNLTGTSVKSKEDPGGRNWFTGSTGRPTGKLQDPRFKPMHTNSSSSNVDGEQPPHVLFGSDLSARCDYEKRMIPAIVSRCIQEVETRGMDVEGIYRKSGGTSQVNQVKSGFSEDDEYDLSDPDLDIHAVTSALKAYLRKMPGPLIPYEIYDEFVAAGAAETNTAKAKGLHAALSAIPKAHYDCLQFLVFHLSRVIQHAKDNLMTPLNIAVVFAPTIMRPADVQRELTDMNIQRDAVQALLENHKNIFFDEE